VDGARHSWANRAVAARALGALVLLGQLCLGGASSDWPQWRGPNRDDISSETGLLKQWPEGGPKLLWTARGIGDGFSTVAIADGMVYTAGNVGSDTVITALDLDGKLKWQAKNGPAFTRNKAGSRSTPTIDGGLLYHKNPDGDLVCLDAKTGKEVWSLNILKEFGGRNITWALAESLLVDGNNLIASPGGPEAAIVAMDKKTGKTVWACKGIDDKPGYSSPILVEQGGLRQIVQMTAQHAIGVNAKTGELLWSFPHKTSYDANIPTPIYHDGHIFINSGYGSGGELLKLTVDGDKASVEQVWKTKALDNHHGGVVLVGGCLYGSTHNGQWVCLDFKTGEVKYKAPGVGKGSLTYADGMLYTYSEGGGKVGLVKATPEGHEIISQFAVPRGGSGPNWAHPVVCGGRLYLRHADYLWAYGIKAE